MAPVCPPQAVGTLEAIFLYRGCARKPEQRSSLGSPQLGVSDGKSAQILSVFLADIGECECEEAALAVKLVNAYSYSFACWSGFSAPTCQVLCPCAGWAHGPAQGGKTLGGTCIRMLAMMAMVKSLVHADAAAK